MSQNFLELVKVQARENPKRILFPETFDERTLKAVAKIVEEGTARPVLLGTQAKLTTDFEKLNLKSDMNKLVFVDYRDPKLLKDYAEKLFELRKSKGVTREMAQKLVEDRNYFSVMMVENRDVDGLITGANCPTADTLRPTLQIIKTKEKFHKVSAFFFMVLENRLLLFADCAVNIAPNSYELADIAIDTAETATCFGIEPKIAMLSFSTAGSGKHPRADIVREATAMVKHRRPDLICDGEMQVDAALVPEISARKYPNSAIKGDANVLIFPNLDAANISYKLVERLGNAHAIGPILQGLRKPVNDLSRGCSVQDIVDLAAITTLEAQNICLPVPKKITSIK